MLSNTQKWRKNDFLLSIPAILDMLFNSVGNYITLTVVCVLIAIYSTAIKSVLCHEKTRDILFLERPQGPREIKFTEFSSDIKGYVALE